MKYILPFFITLILMSCNHSAQTKETIDDSETKEKSIDTVIVKTEYKIDKYYEIGFNSKSFTYSWVTEKDTLDFKIGLQQMKDSTVQLRIFHRDPILLSDALNKANECLPLISQDFNLDNLRYLYLEPPIFYKDMTTELSKSYKNQFGQKNINYQELNEFLINSWLEKKIGAFLHQFHKSTRRYGIEKFHLLEKDNYGEYIPNTDLSDYPSFSIHGMGISVYLNEKKNKKPEPNNG